MKSKKIQPNKKNEKKRKIINLALVVFAISIAIFTVIGALVIDNFSHLQQIDELSALEETDEYKGEIDQRLRFIAMQDEENANNNFQPNQESNNPEGKIEDPVLLEPIDINDFLNANKTIDSAEAKKTKFTEYNEKYRKKEFAEATEKTNNMEQNALEIPFKNEFKVNSPLNLKVLIGNYATKEEAQAELEKIGSQFSTPPFIKTINNRYSIQVAAFKTPDTAYEFVNSLRQQGFNARIIEE